MSGAPVRPTPAERRRPGLATGRHASRGFTLAEIAIAVLVLSLLGVFGLGLLTNTQAAQRRGEAQRQLEEVRTALLGFAITNGRLPCPAATAPANSNGNESFAATGNATNGRCSAFNANAATQGLLPARTLGLPGISADGLLRDPWGQPIRYSVAQVALSGDAPPNACTPAAGTCRLLASNGLTGNLGTLADASVAGRYLRICDSAACTNVLASDVAVVLASGIDAAGAGGADETENLDGDTDHVFHEPREATGTGGRYAHLMLWLPRTVLIDALARAGRL